MRNLPEIFLRSFDQCRPSLPGRRMPEPMHSKTDRSTFAGPARYPT